MQVNVNARSLKKNFDNLELCLDSLNVKFDIIAVSKNWLDKESKNSYNISGYQVIHVVRENTHGGGCSLYIKMQLNTSYLSLLLHALINFMNVLLLKSRLVVKLS